MKTTWKDIPPVPTSQEFLDIVLSRTQRRLPTQIRSGFKISRIRGFYTRKVKFTQETFSEKFSQILESFPRLEDIHPFHKDLLNTLYDSDHYKIALGQLSTAKHLMESISRDYVRLLKCEYLPRSRPFSNLAGANRIKQTPSHFSSASSSSAPLLVAWPRS